MSFMTISIYFCTNITILFAFICNSTTLYSLIYLLLLATKSDHFALHAGDSSYSPLVNCASCPGLHIGAGQPGRAPYWELTLSSYCSQLSDQNCAYCVLGLPGPAAFPAGVQPDSGMDHDNHPFTVYQIRLTRLRLTLYS
ncbi:hypothetical protein DSO57_1002036 [Entomophthora muscae]|uniref:Uncharacterized protein n=1 Tax=Entomophthora muscae TaxID=34485 RepID=A0ACC2SB14_9FUNG|nr:hypothetical protein DSO57_1002036 [Entomophthora muscae]